MTRVSPRPNLPAALPTPGPVVSPLGDICALPAPRLAEPALPPAGSIVSPLGDLCALPAPRRTEAPAGSSTAFNLRVAQMSGGRDALALELNTLQGRLALVAPTLPAGGGAALQAALVGTGQRILSSLDAGRITPEEARQAMHSVAEMVDALEAVEKGQVTVSKSGNAMDANATAFDVTTTSKDVLRVMVRTTGDEKGQARLKLTQVADDGVAVPATQRLMVRVDLEGSEKADAALDASVDVEFGDGKAPPPGQQLLDLRIHGVILDDKGQPVLSRGGNPIADHHFSEGIPDALKDRDGFRIFTQGFLDQVLPRETAPQA